MMSYLELEELEEKYANGGNHGLTAVLQVARQEIDKEVRERESMLITQFDRLKTRYNMLTTTTRDYRLPDDELLQEAMTALKRLKDNKARIDYLKGIKL